MANRRDEPGANEFSEKIGNEVVEAIRREHAMELNGNAGTRPQLVARHGQVWDPEDLARDFEVIGFATPYVIVRRKIDGTMGSLEFQHHPRFYFNFQQDQRV
jgi:hypothetical protein